MAYVTGFMKLTNGLGLAVKKAAVTQAAKNGSPFAPMTLQAHQSIHRKRHIFRSPFCSPTTSIWHQGMLR
jgi:hypothetical protein